ncbi:MAG: class I SAM-dependent methyltransferase [Pseudomonadota bacterium]
MWIQRLDHQVKILTDGYQYDFSKNSPHVFDRENRERKARTMVAVLRDFLDKAPETLTVLNVGGSAGAIDNYLADHFAHVTGIDIDQAAIEHAQSNFSKENLSFQVADALNMPFPNESFDVVICSHVYEHVADPEQMFEEIKRVLRPDGVCYFAAGNRLMWNEPHYNLPLLSVIPRPLAHLYMRLSGKGDYYHETHLWYWGLKRLTSDFQRHDYTLNLVEKAGDFHTDYMLPPGSLKTRIAAALGRFAYWAFPGYVWLLKKGS